MNKSNHALYIEEREGKNIIEDEYGFATYFFPEKHIVYIEDVFVRKEHRRKGIAFKYADEIVKKAKAVGCKFLLGSIDPKAKGAEYSRLFVVDYGLVFSKRKDNLEWYCKEI